MTSNSLDRHWNEVYFILNQLEFLLKKKGFKIVNKDGQYVSLKFAFAK